MAKPSRLPFIKALADDLGLPALAQLEARLVRERPVPPRLIARLLLPETTALTPRQREVMVLLTSGLTRKEMAAELGVGEETIKTHLQRSYRKLGVHRQIDAINVFLEERS